MSMLDRNTNSYIQQWGEKNGTSRASSDQEPQEELVYTIAEVARLLKVSEQVVRQIVLSGELKSKKVGRLYRIPKHYLEEYLNQ